MIVVNWSELRPDDLRRRLSERPIAYLPMGLCEPHGHVAALGLDLFKAEWLCREAAAGAGGVVAPSQAYQIHETGFHARWLHDVVGDAAGGLLAIPPHVACLNLLYQLRALANAGVRVVVVVTGHVGGSEEDLERWAASFERAVGLRVVVIDDVRLSGERGDHAGSYELSALMHIRPDLVDMSLIDRQRDAGSGGRLALGETAADASAADGRRIMEAARQRLLELVEELEVPPPTWGVITHRYVESIYEAVLADLGRWTSAHPHPGQEPVPPDSRWAAAERVHAADVLGCRVSTSGETRS